MRIIPLAEAAQLEDGENVLAVQGTLTKLYDRTAGTSANGDWSFQKGLIKDKTGEMTVKFKDLADQKHWKGKEVLIQCTQSKHGWTGMKIKDDEYKGKVTRLLWITASADIGSTGNGEHAPQQQQTADAPKPPVKQAAPRQEDRATGGTPSMVSGEREAAEKAPKSEPEAAKRTEPGSREAVMEVARWATQIANLQVLAISRVEKYVAPLLKEKYGIQLDTVARHAWAMNMAMQLEIEVKAMWKMPQTEYAMAKAQQQAAAPAKADEPYQPGSEG